MRISSVPINFGNKYNTQQVLNKKILNKPSYFSQNPNNNTDYTQALKIALTNTIYNRRKGIGEHSVEGYAFVAKFFNIKNFITLGGESAVFDLNDGNILKISVNKYHDYLPEFYAPEVTRGVIKTERMYKIFSLLEDKETDTFYYVIQKKGQLNVSEEDEKTLINKAKKAGYELDDLKWDQFAYFDINGKKETRFVDLGCIV